MSQWLIERSIDRLIVVQSKRIFTSLSLHRNDRKWIQFPIWSFLLLPPSHYSHNHRTEMIIYITSYNIVLMLGDRFQLNRIRVYACNVMVLKRLLHYLIYKLSQREIDLCGFVHIRNEIQFDFLSSTSSDTVDGFDHSCRSIRNILEKIWIKKPHTQHLSSFWNIKTNYNLNLRRNDVELLTYRSDLSITVANHIQWTRTLPSTTLMNETDKNVSNS